MKDKPTHYSVYNSLIAGAVAGGIEAAMTYPTEYVKTQLQLPNAQQRFKGPIDCIVKTIKGEEGIRGLYRGVSAMVLGTALKAGVRFLVYDDIRAKLNSSNNEWVNFLLPTQFTKTIMAGLGAGVMEALLVVTPTETIKTKLIQDRNSPSPKYKGLVNGVRLIVKEEGITGIYRGVVPVVLRQGANSAVRLSVYQGLKDFLLNRYEVKQLNPIVTFGLGMVAGTITVYSTMPIDVVKTKMQAKTLDSPYKSSLGCLLYTAKKDGLTALFKGATPRLSRLIFSGGIVFTIYEQVMGLLSTF